MLKEIIRMCNTEETGLNEYKLIFSEDICDISKITRINKLSLVLESIKKKRKIDNLKMSKIFRNIDLAVNYMKQNLDSSNIKKHLNLVKSEKESQKAQFSIDLPDSSNFTILSFMLAIISIALSVLNFMFSDLQKMLDQVSNDLNMEKSILSLIISIIMLIVVIHAFIASEISNFRTKKYKKNIRYLTYLYLQLEESLSSENSVNIKELQIKTCN